MNKEQNLNSTDNQQLNIAGVSKRYMLKGYLVKGLNNIEHWEIPVERKNDKWYHFNTDKPIDNYIVILNVTE